MNAIVDIAGWTLIHFFWQGTLVALLAAAVLRVLRQAAPQARYLTACAGLGLMLIAPLVTARIVWQQAAPLRAAATPSPAANGSADAGIGAARPQTTGPAIATTSPSLPNAAAVRRLLPSLVTVWIAGVGILLVRFTGGWWRVRRLRRQSLAAEPSPWH